MPPWACAGWLWLIDTAKTNVNANPQPVAILMIRPIARHPLLMRSV